jgi:hypothetical protein
MLTAAALMQACCGAGSRLCRPPYASPLMSLLIDIPLSTARLARQDSGAASELPVLGRTPAGQCHAMIRYSVVNLDTFVEPPHAFIGLLRGARGKGHVTDLSSDTSSMEDGAVDAGRYLTTCRP